jgi:hypothetical protein
VLRAGHTVQMSPTECGVPECGHEASNMMISWSIRGCQAVKKKVWEYLLSNYVTH